MTSGEDHNTFPQPQSVDSVDTLVGEAVVIKDPVAVAQRHAGELATRANSGEEVSPFVVRQAQKRAMELAIEANASLVSRIR